MEKNLAFDAEIQKIPTQNAAYIEIPFDVKDIFGRSRVLVHATFNGEPYDGQVVKTGASSYTIGIRRDIRKKIRKQPGDTVHVTITERMPAPPAFSTVTEYIKGHDEEVSLRMEKLREIILECTPDSKETISWGMPTFLLHGNFVHFAAHRYHMGFYPSPSAILAFKESLKEYQCSKGAVQFSYAKPMPYDLLRSMIAFRIEEQRNKR